KRRVQPIAIDRADADHLHATVAADGDVDGVAGLAAPQLLVELLLRRHADPVDADDQVAPTEAGGTRGAGFVEAVHHHATGLAHRVEPEPGARPPAHDPPG